MNFAELISASRVFLERFDYDDYPDDLASFEEKAAPLFAELAFRDPEDAARELIRHLEKGREELSWKKASDARREEKTVMALYLGPAARRFGAEAVPFVEALQQQWNALYPRNTFIPGEYETIMKGFDSTLIGIKLRKSKKLRRNRDKSTGTGTVD